MSMNLLGSMRVVVAGWALSGVLGSAHAVDPAAAGRELLAIQILPSRVESPASSPVAAAAATISRDPSLGAVFPELNAEALSGLEGLVAVLPEEVALDLPGVGMPPLLGDPLMRFDAMSWVGERPASSDDDDQEAGSATRCTAQRLGTDAFISVHGRPGDDIPNAPFTLQVQCEAPSRVRLQPMLNGREAAVWPATLQGSAQRSALVLEATVGCAVGSLGGLSIEVRSEATVDLCVLAYQRDAAGEAAYPNHGGYIVAEGAMSLQLVSQPLASDAASTEGDPP